MGSAPTSVLARLASLACLLTLVPALGGPSPGPAGHCAILPDTEAHLLFAPAAPSERLAPAPRSQTATTWHFPEEELRARARYADAVPSARLRLLVDCRFGLSPQGQIGFEDMAAVGTGIRPAVELALRVPLRL